MTNKVKMIQSRGVWMFKTPFTQTLRDVNTMSTPNFEALLRQSPTEVVRPPQLPEGTYLCVIGDWEHGLSSKKKTDFVKFALRPIAALEDVDAEALAKIDGLEGKNLSVTFYITEKTVGMLDEFHQNAGIDLTDGTERLDRCNAIKNEQILATIKHRIDDDDPSRIFAEVRRTAKAD